jgi:DNA (cytosine-5)-methyltransferase 1
MNTKYTGLSLFSGMGGDTLGMENAGINVIAYSEKIDTYKKTHQSNFPNSKLIGESVKSDIVKIEDAEFIEYHNKIDFIFAGFPCQGFSNAGKKKVNDPRNSLFKEFVRVTNLVKPRVIIGENVKGLLTRKTDSNEKYIDIIVQEFNNIGYSVIYKVFDCHKYGIPQKRQRLIILGIRNDCLNEFNLSFPNETNTPTNLLNIINFNMSNTLSIPPNVFDFSTIPQECVMTNMDNEEEEQMAHPYLKLKRDIENKTYANKTHDQLFSFAKRDSPIHCEIIDVRNPAKTIICTYNHQPRLFVPIINKNGQFLRSLLPDELKQIQSFPLDYIVEGNVKDQITQIGNAVPPYLIEQICKHILKID